MKTALDLVSAAKERIHETPVSGAEDAIRQADILIDVREADEYATGHLPGAIHIPRGLLEFKLSNDPAFQARDLRIVLYCKNSGRAALSAVALGEMGYVHVTSIEGGIDAWEAAGKPLATPSLPDFG